MELYSYHVFMFPFRWENADLINQPFSERVNLRKIKMNSGSKWENLPMPKTSGYIAELYNEKNFFYQFVHPVLYDVGTENELLKHYERIEAYHNELTYKIEVIAGFPSTYNLRLRSLVLNLYSTGVGIFIFYLENNSYPDKSDILRINQFGRRVYPPFIDPMIGVNQTKNLINEFNIFPVEKADISGEAR